ncbi:MAG: hypothetical protein AMJ56_18225, partial [Anaerolineae bacterium SG8_19]
MVDYLADTRPNLMGPMGRWRLPIGFLIIILFTVACQTQPNQIFIEVDGSRQALTTEADTVREALAEAKIVLGPLDRVKPDLYAQLEQGLIIVVTRIEEETEVRREVIPFERQTITNEALAPGETKVIQLGVNGEDEITIRVIFEDGVEVGRTELLRQSVIEPVPEILVVGPQGEIPSVPISGTISYLSNGNAWIMRDSSGSRRAITTEGNLDGRVLSLSPDGRQLLYTTALTEDIELPLNELWLASTTIIGEKPITTGIRGVLQAEWSPVISQALVAYTTAERVANPPGWKANNDLWLWEPGNPTAEPVQILPPSTPGLYPWWGTTFKWSPQGDRLAYARSDEIGIVSLEAEESPANKMTPILDFVPLKTFGEWVWVPGFSWSPEGNFIAATVHGPPLASEPADESQLFDLWLISSDGKLTAKVAEQVGMWANPAWGELGIAFGQAVNPLQSVDSRYSIQLMDRDGSNKRQLFPFQTEPGVQFPELVWSPEKDDLLFTYNGKLFLTTTRGAPPQQLMTDGQATLPQWVAEAPVITRVTTVTQETTVATTVSITTNELVTERNSISPTSTISAVPTITRSRPTLTPTLSITN